MRIESRLLIIAATISLLLFMQAQAVGAEPDSEDEASGNFNGSIKISALDNYIWRGYNIYGPGVAAAWENMTLGFEKPGAFALNLNLFASQPLKNHDELKKTGGDEIEASLGGAIELTQQLTLGLGAVFYATPFADDFWHTEEVYVTLAFNYNGFNLTAGNYIDVNDVKGVYFFINPSYSVNFVEKLSLNVGTILAGTSYKGQNSKFVELGGKGSLDYEIINGLFYSIGMNYLVNIYEAKTHHYLISTLAYRW